MTGLLSGSLRARRLAVLARTRNSVRTIDAMDPQTPDRVHTGGTCGYNKPVYRILRKPNGEPYPEDEYVTECCSQCEALGL